jgi:hypothetical protein
MRTFLKDFTGIMVLNAILVQKPDGKRPLGTPSVDQRIILNGSQKTGFEDAD